MEHPGDSRPNLAGLVDHLFERVLSESERVDLLRWIREWEAANPDVDAAHRVTGWIDVAYAFQARADRLQESRAAVNVSRWDPRDWGLASSTA